MSIPRDYRDWTPSLIVAEFALRGIKPLQWHSRHCAFTVIALCHDYPLTSDGLSRFCREQQERYPHLWLRGLMHGFDGLIQPLDTEPLYLAGAELGRTVHDLLWNPDHTAEPEPSEEKEPMRV